MTVHLSIVLFAPLIMGVVGALLGPSAPWAAVAGAALVLGYSVVMLLDFEQGAAGLQYATDDACAPPSSTTRCCVPSKPRSA